jgi:hypothetical protein
MHQSIFAGMGAFVSSDANSVNDDTTRNRHDGANRLSLLIARAMCTNCCASPR